MFGPLGALVGLAADVVFDTVSNLSVPVAEEIWRTRARDSRQVTDSAALQEIAEHLGAIRAQLEEVIATQRQVADVFKVVNVRAGDYMAALGIDIPEPPDIFRSGGQTKQFGPRPHISTQPPSK
jgi:hypothetical protein